MKSETLSALLYYHIDALESILTGLKLENLEDTQTAAVLHGLKCILTGLKLDDTKTAAVLSRLKRKITPARIHLDRLQKQSAEVMGDFCDEINEILVQEVEKCINLAEKTC